VTRWTFAATLASLLLATACAHDPAATRSLATLQIEPGARPVLSYRWKLDLTGAAHVHRPQEFASAVLSETGTRIFVGSHEGRFYALDRASGEVLWRVELGSVSSRPLVSEGRIYVGTDDGSLVCISALDGELKWRYATKGPVLEPPVISGDLVFFANEADHVYALDRRTGKFRWQYKSDTPDEYTMRGHSGVAVIDENLIATGFANGNLVALRAGSGSVAWITSLSAGNDQFVDVDSTPVVADGTLFASSSASGVFAIDAATGRIKWRLPVNGAGAVTTDGEALYFTAAGEGVFAADLTGNILWRQGTHGGGESGTPVVAGTYLFYSLSDAGMFIVDKATGTVRQFFDPGFGVSAPPTVADDDLFVVSNGAVLYAMSVRAF